MANHDVTLTERRRRGLASQSVRREAPLSLDDRRAGQVTDERRDDRVGRAVGVDPERSRPRVPAIGQSHRQLWRRIRCIDALLPPETNPLRGDLSGQSALDRADLRAMLVGHITRELALPALRPRGIENHRFARTQQHTRLPTQLAVHPLVHLG